ncbi:hypothetical protein B9N43_04020 [Denitratisoma sp. DHT3]|nr:hypothetical protein B9N43_04020 [Denitratisoma sp. DHT3]
MKRPDPTEMANDLFSKLDTSGQGYIEKADLQSAFDQAASKTNASDTSTNVDDLFSKLDADSDGKVTKQEFSDSLQKLADQLDQQFQSGRMQDAMPSMGGMPPGPPPGAGEDAGKTKEELTSAATEVSGSDSGLSSMLTNIVQNFDAADTNQDGKVTMQEIIAYQQSQSTAESGTSTAAASGSAGKAASSSNDFEAKLMMQIMKLADAYGLGHENTHASTSSLTVTA